MVAIETLMAAVEAFCGTRNLTIVRDVDGYTVSASIAPSEYLKANGATLPVAVDEFALELRRVVNIEVDAKQREFNHLADRTLRLKNVTTMLEEVLR